MTVDRRCGFVVQRAVTPCEPQRSSAAEGERARCTGVGLEALVVVGGEACDVRLAVRCRPDMGETVARHGEEGVAEADC